jgi:hypothetical protein
MEDVWEPAVATIEANFERTKQNFETALQTFIAAHAAIRDRHALVPQLWHTTKPRDLSVQAYQYRLFKLNNAVKLLPR